MCDRGNLDFRTVGNPDEGSTRTDGDPARRVSTEIEGKLNTAILYIEQVHEHMYGQPIHDCRKLKNALRILNDVRVHYE